MLSQLKDMVFYTTQIAQVLMFIVGSYFFGISLLGWYISNSGYTGNYPPAKRFALIIAAHNEERVIAHIIDSLFMQNYHRNNYDVFVIADNCTDNTAGVAKKHGAIV